MSTTSTPKPMTTLLRIIRGPLLTALVCQILASALVLSPLITGAIIARQLWDDPTDPAIWSTLAVGTVLLTIGLLFKGLADLIAHLADNSLTLILRRRLAARLRGAPLGWFTETSAGQVKQGMQDDVTALHHLVAHSYNELAAAIATPIVAYGYLFFIDWRLAAILLIPVPTFVLIYGRMIAASGEKMDEYGQVLADINIAVVEFVDGIPVVKSFGQTGRAHEAFRAAVQRFTTFFIGWTRPLVTPETIAYQIVASVTLLALTLVFGTTFIGLDWMEPVDIVPFVLVGLGVGGPISALTANVIALQMGQASADRLNTLLDLEQVSEPQNRCTPADTRLELDHVSFGYSPEQEVIHNLTATFEPGSVTAIVGASGSGKTTLARLMLRYADPTAGQVRLGGIPLTDIATDDLFRTVGSVFQDVRLLRMSVAENIALAQPDAPREVVEQAAKDANIHQRILRLPRGYDSVIGKDATFSGGEAQRISIARAFLLDPEVLILDEDTSAADAESEHAIQAALSTLVSQRSRTVIVIAHRLDTIRAADHILVLDAGRFVEHGSHDELIAQGGAYSRHWRAQHRTEDIA